MIYDYKTLSMQQIKDIMDKYATEEQKKAFKEAVFVEKTKKVSVNEVDEKGNYIEYQVKDKNGKPKVDKNGNPVMRKKKKMIATNEKKDKPIYSHLKAKDWIITNMLDKIEMINTPNKEHKPTAEDLFGNW